MRFAEFTTKWEQFSLRSITERVTRRNKNNETTLPLTISAQYGLIDQSLFFDRQIASKDMSNYYLLLNGEFAYNKSYSNDYAFGTVKRLDLYPMGALSSLYFCFKPHNDICSDFLVHYFETTKWHRGISDIAGEGARNHGLLNMSVEDYFDTQHYLPQREEQEKIARLFNLLTQRIETQSKIIEDLELQEKWIYSHILQTNSNEIELNDILREFNNKSTSNNEYPILSSTMNGIFIQSEYFTKQTASDSTIGYKIVPYGYATYRSMSDTGEFHFNLQKIVQCGIVSPAYPVFCCDNTNNLEFIILLLNHYQGIKKQLQMIKQGGTRLALPFSSLCKLKIPKFSLDVQNHIVSIVSDLDAKLQIEKDILAAYKKQKAYLSSEMFI